MTYDFLPEKHQSICLWIDKNMTIKTGFNRSKDSYSLKHDCESGLGEYVSNYEFVYCMMVCGFKAKKTAIYSQNFYFNFNYKKESIWHQSWKLKAQ